MKKTHIYKLITLTLLLITFGAHAEETQVISAEAKSKAPAKFVANISPLYLLLNGFGGKFDVALTKTTSIGLGGGFFNYHNEREGSSTTASNQDYDALYQEIGVGPTFMITGTLNTDGVYIAPSVGYLKAEIKNYGIDDLGAKFESPFARATIGYQWVYSNDIRLGLGGGLLAVKSNNDIVVKDDAGREIERTKFSRSGNFALDFHLGMTF